MSARIRTAPALALAVLFLAAASARAEDADIALRNLYWSASQHSEAGDYEKAIALYTRVLEQAPKVWGEGSKSHVAALINLGYLCHTLGRYDRAEILLEKALRFSRGKDRQDQLQQALEQLARVYLDLHRFDRAELLLKRNLELRTSDSERADGLRTLAHAYLTMGANDRAEKTYQQALKLYEEVWGNGSDEVAEVLSSMGLLAMKAGQPDKARWRLERSLKIMRRNHEKDPGAALNVLYRLGLFHAYSQVDYARAESYFRQVRDVSEKHHPRSTRQDLLNHELGLLAACRGRLADAAGCFERQRRWVRQHVSAVLPVLTLSEQIDYLLNEDAGHFYTALSLAARHPEDESLARHSAGWLLNGKALINETLTRSTLAARDSGDPAVRKVGHQLLAVRRKLARVTSARMGITAAALPKSELDELFAQEQKLTRTLQRIGSRSANAATDWVELAAARKALPEGSVLVDVARIPVLDFASRRWEAYRYVAWLTPREGPVRVVDLGTAEVVDRAVAAVRQALEAAKKRIRSDGEAEAEKSLRGPLESLSKLVLVPLLPAIGKAPQWQLSPDGNLWLVPWEALLLPDGRFAIEAHRICYLTSGRDLAAPARPRVKPAAALVLADPDFDLRADEAAAESRRVLGDAVREEHLTRSLSRSLRLGRIERLAGTAAEAKAIAPALRSWTEQPPRVLTGKRALKDVLLAAHSPRALVLCTHGFFLPDQEAGKEKRLAAQETRALPPGWESPLLRCGLLLAGCNQAAKAPGGQDGVVTGLEVGCLDLRGTELVVLSACETGLGDVQTGEGVAGLRQAFQVAGARSVVSTLWQIPDRQSARLMALFFAQLAKGKSKVEALRAAKLQIIEERREDFAAAHPFFWAAFTLTGQP
jgi:CHAT domain-containing protein/tetratricopeptide (TPR) repeat protein